MAKKEAPERKVVAQNRKARHNYFIDEVLEAGIMLAGTEVKSLRQGKANIGDAYASDKGGEIWLYNMNIPEYDSGGYTHHEEKRARKLLLKKREIAKLLGAVQREGVTLVPLSIYFNPRGIAKVELGLARGKKQYDKRETEKKREWNKQQQRLLRERG
ncbi:MAG TPA: SsrA-binding protein SmpB [Alphaproteobacteria bacterium]|jgi:SsrA-binding protein